MSDSGLDAIDERSALGSVPELPGLAGRAIAQLDRLLMAVAICALVGLAATVTLQIVVRLLLPFTLSWTEELSRYLFIYMVAMSAGVVVHRRRNLSVELFHDWLGPRGQALFLIFSSAMAGAFALIVLPHAWQYARIGLWQHSPTLGVSMIYMFCSSVALFGLVALYGLIGVAEGVNALARGAPASTGRSAP
ncbi:TRAP transporter small permease [Halotalea alkalilenta]|uniref:TRAP transporter small permease n=1 Tax=Halotalea alkalilenta TaxID=376489 RepID=UPI0004826F3F|nr:TRAP transporter small permease [Halotalea alkalilenta]